jgi:biopolymer transport protein ExbD
MDITLPPSETKSEVTEASLLLVRLMEDGRIFWNMGTDAPHALDANALRAFLQERINTNPTMITLVKVDRKSKYSNMVRIIDELHLANITRYSLAPLLEQDKKIVEQAAGKS